MGGFVLAIGAGCRGIKSMDELLARYCSLKPGLRPNLSTWATAITGSDIGPKDKGVAQVEDLGRRIAELQRRLWAERKHKVLLVLQGMDTSGKDGTIRHVFRFTNPNGVNVAAFERPTPRELGYDYLWRIHQRVPHKGEIVIFDRSHYEDIVTVRVNQLQPDAVWQRRYAHINAFEEMLTDEGVTIIKVFLHISHDEQKQRLQARLNDPEKHWKFHDSDLVARQRWPEYMAAYADVLERCNTEAAPWFVIPSDRKWQRNLLVAGLLHRVLSNLKMAFPPAHFDPGKIAL